RRERVWPIRPASQTPKPRSSTFMGRRSARRAVPARGATTPSGYVEVRGERSLEPPADPDREQPARFELEAVDVLVDRERDEGEGAPGGSRLDRHARAEEEGGVAAVGRVRLGPVLAAVPAGVGLELRGDAAGVEVADAGVEVHARRGQVAGARRQRLV